MYLPMIGGDAPDDLDHPGPLFMSAVGEVQTEDVDSGTSRRRIISSLVQARSKGGDIFRSAHGCIQVEAEAQAYSRT